MTTTNDYDPDELARLEEQRSFLRRSLDDLDRELAAGDIDPADHAALSEDYRRRLEETDGQVDEGRAAVPPAKRRPGRIVAAVVLVAVVALAAGFTVANVVGGRKPGETITGNVPRTTDQLLSDAANLAQQGKYTEALKVYDQVLARDKTNIEAMSERGFLLVTTGIGANQPLLIEQGRIAIEDAVKLSPNDPRLLFYLSIALRADGEKAGAVKALADALNNNPSADLRASIEDYQASINEADSSTTTTAAP
ncbi:MAG TPA: c-type cytochrome biogenesis protein CcmI [Acidimicrobiales bacterium]|jgi:cytochrome c-type biogenesis protein CcmI